MEVQVSLDFACCGCGQSVSVTVQCSGEGLSGGSRAVARVQVPCPCGCGTVNLLEFTPSGTVCGVLPYRMPWPLPQPSVN